MNRLLSTSLLAAAAAVAARQAVRRWEAADDPTEGRPLELPDGRERTVTTVDGARLAVREMGDLTRPPIVLAHGWTADRRVWGPVARRLVAAGHHVVVYDERGHGASTVGSAGLSVPSLADDVKAVLEELDATDAVLAGHSMGGMAVQTFAVIHKATLVDRVGHLLLVSTAARSPLFGGPGSTWERAAVAATGNPVVARAFASPAVGPWLVRASVGRRPSMVALRATQASLVATPAATRIGFLQEMAGLDLVADLTTIPVPTTVVYGSHDRLTLPGLNREIAGLIPGARSVVLHGAGHQLPFETPDQLADLLADAAS